MGITFQYYDIGLALPSGPEANRKPTYMYKDKYDFDELIATAKGNADCVPRREQDGVINRIQR